MTIARRVGALEADGDATERVVRWLEEAHAYGSLDAYVPAVLDAGREAFPLDRLPREARDAIRARRGRSSGDVDAEIRATTRAILFRVYLVLRIHEVTSLVLDRASLVRLLLTAHVGIATYAKEVDDRPLLSLETIRELLILRATDLEALQQARTSVEARYLAGHVALFPDKVLAWDEEVETTRGVANMACRLAEFNGAEPLDDEQPAPTAEQVEEWTRDLVERARIEALDDMGDGPAMLSRTRAYLARDRQEKALPLPHTEQNDASPS